MTFAAELASKDFKRATITRLGKKGIRIIGIQMVPGSGPLPWADATRCYVVDDNDTGRVWSHAEVVAAGSAK